MKLLLSGAFGFLADYLVWLILYVSLLIHAYCFFRFFSRKRPRLRLILGNVIVGACMLATVGIVAETYLRFLSIRTDSFGVTMPARRWFAMYVDLNSRSCRDVEWTLEKPEGVRRIAFVGDSYTYGWGIEDPADRFTDIIQQRFDERAPGSVEVMNVAIPGWDTGEQVEPVRDLIELYDVDEVVLCYVPNDIEKILPPLGEDDPTKPPEPSFMRVDMSAVFEYFYYRLAPRFAPTVKNYHDWLAEGYADQELSRKQQARLGTMIGACKEQDVAFRAVLLPFLVTGGQKFDTPSMQAHLKKIFDAHEIESVDVWPALSGERPGRLIVNSLDAHPNERAHALIADSIWQALYAR